MKTYTVIGYYTDTDQPYLDWVEVEDDKTAMDAAYHVVRIQDHGDLVILAAFDGKLEEKLGLERSIDLDCVEMNEGSGDDGTT